MKAIYTPGDLKIELSAIGHEFEETVSIPPVTYDLIVDRIMQSSLSDRQNENFISILIFHSLTRVFKKDVAYETALRDDLFEISVRMTQRVFEMEILEELGQERPYPPEHDPHNPITGVNTIPRTSSLDLSLKAS